MATYSTANFCLLRTPTFPMEYLLELNKVLADWSSSRSKEAVASLKNIFANEIFVEAIYLASKDLYASLQAWLNEENVDLKKLDKLLSSLHKYYSRMCTRSTPYGLFAGCFLADVTDSKSKIEFEVNKLNKIVRFDSSFLVNLTERLATRKEIQSRIKYYANTSVYAVGNKQVYVDYTTINGKRSYSLSTLTSSPYITNVLAKARFGATLAELAECVAGSGAGAEAIQSFLEGLIAAQFLTSELEPVVTAKGSAQSLLATLQRIGCASSLTTLVEKAQHSFLVKNIPLEQLQQLEQQAQHSMPLLGTDLLQADVFYQVQASNLKREVIEEITATSSMLQALVSPFTPKDLEDFKRRFVARYEEREVSLVQALDPDSGIGYGLAINGNVENMPLLTGVQLRSTADTKPAAKSGALTALVARKMREYTLSHTATITLEDEDIASIVDHKKDQTFKATSAYIFGSLYADSAQALDEGDYLFQPTQLHSPYAGKLLARFAHGVPGLESRLHQLCVNEQAANPDVVIAEVVYLPAGHYANLTLRPQLRQYEIPYLCRSLVAPEQQIAVTDLLVSVRQDRVVLRSARLQKEVMPALTNAYNSKLGQPLYRFLADVEAQHCKVNFYWPWTAFLEEPFLPRVEYKKFILSRARWLLKKTLVAKMDRLAQQAHFAQLRVERNLPRYVVLSNGGDNELLVDLDNPFCQDHLLQSLRKEDLLLYEFLQETNNKFIKDAAGNYTSEIIIPIETTTPFYSPKVIAAARGSLVSEDSDAVVRAFVPGSHWMFFKIYGGNKALETILKEIIAPFSTEALAEKAISKWFFIRYNDPENHLRVRFLQGDNDQAWKNLLTILSQQLAPYVESGQISSLMLDTYVRELERYGYATIEESETIFYADSVAVTGILTALAGSAAENHRWQIALRGIDRLLTDFGYDGKAKLHLIKEVHASFLEEFSGGEPGDVLRLKQTLNDKYRRHSAEINRLLLGSSSAEALEVAKAMFDERAVLYKESIDSISRKTAHLSLPQSLLDSLVKSYIHMFTNRLFLSRRREHEVVVYHYLERYYTSLVARGKTTTAASIVTA